MRLMDFDGCMARYEVLGQNLMATWLDSDTLMKILWLQLNHKNSSLHIASRPLISLRKRFDGHISFQNSINSLSSTINAFLDFSN